MQRESGRSREILLSCRKTRLIDSCLFLIRVEQQAVSMANTATTYQSSKWTLKWLKFSYYNFIGCNSMRHLRETIKLWCKLHRDSDCPFSWDTVSDSKTVLNSHLGLWELRNLSSSAIWMRFVSYRDSWLSAFRKPKSPDSVFHQISCIHRKVAGPRPLLLQSGSHETAISVLMANFSILSFLGLPFFQEEFVRDYSAIYRWWAEHSCERSVRLL